MFSLQSVTVVAGLLHREAASLLSRISDTCRLNVSYRASVLPSEVSQKMAVPSISSCCFHQIKRLVLKILLLIASLESTLNKSPSNYYC